MQALTLLSSWKTFPVLSQSLTQIQIWNCVIMSAAAVQIRFSAARKYLEPHTQFYNYLLRKTPETFHFISFLCVWYPQRKVAMKTSSAIRRNVYSLGLESISTILWPLCSYSVHGLASSFTLLFTGLYGHSDVSCFTGRLYFWPAPASLFRSIDRHSPFAPNDDWTESHNWKKQKQMIPLIEKSDISCPRVMQASWFKRWKWRCGSKFKLRMYAGLCYSASKQIRVCFRICTLIFSNLKAFENEWNPWNHTLLIATLIWPTQALHIFPVSR